MAKTNLIDLKTVADTIKAYKIEIKKATPKLNKQYSALDKESDRLYSLEKDVEHLEELLSMGKALSKVKK